MWRTKRAILKRALAVALCFAFLFWGSSAALFSAYAEAPEAGAARRFAIELMEHINAARAKVGVQPLTLDFALCQPAQARAEECLVADMRTQEGAQPGRTEAPLTLCSTRSAARPFPSRAKT